MAFIYQYDLVRSGEEIFNIYDNDNMEIIENTIRDIFGGRVKEIDIESEDGTNRPGRDHPSRPLPLGAPRPMIFK